MSDPERRARWNERWTRRDYADTEPAAVVHDYTYLLPPGGEVLEVACGLGVNALHLAAAGFRKCIHLAGLAPARAATMTVG